MESNNVTAGKPKRSFIKKLFRFLFFSALFALFLLGSLVAFLFVYEDEVKQAILTELNKHLKVEVKVDPKNIDLTIIKTFPDCSLQFNDALMLESLKIKNKDTLLFARQINLNFNIKDLWNKKYNIQKIEVKDGIVKMRVTKQGKENYIFWAEEASSTGNTEFNLELIKLENIKFSYINHKAFFKTSLNIKTLAFNGNFKSTNYVLGSKASLQIEEIIQNKTSFLKKKDLSFDIKMDVAGPRYNIQKANLKLNDLALILKGNLVYSDSLEKIAVDFDAPELEIKSLMSLLPENYRSVINDYESNGNLYARGNFSFKNKKSFLFKSNFGISKATITYKPGSTTAENVNIEGAVKYTNNSTALDLKNIYLNLKQDEIKGNCSITNFSDPHLNFNVAAKVKLENVQSFWPIDTLKTLKGNLAIMSSFEGLLSDLKSQTFSAKVKLDLNATVQSLEAQFKGDDKIYAIENCAVIAREREIKVEDLRIKRGSSDLNLNGTIPGLFNYLVDKSAPLIINGTLNSNYIKMEDFMFTGNSNSDKNLNDQPFIPMNMRFKLDATIGRLTLGKFVAEKITGDVEVKDQKAIFNEVRLSAMDGNAEINAFIDNSRNKLEVVVQSNLSNLDVNELFKQMNNFGQTTLQDKNIRGILTASVDFSAVWSNNLIVDEKSITANCNMIIDRGELIDFKPLLSLSKFVEIDDLKRIKFSSLQSNIQIANRTITIPRTFLKNSALNIEVWGTHNFENDVDYHIQLVTSELLAKKRKSKDTEFGPIADDPEKKRMAYIRMTGNIDKLKIKYDKQGMKMKIKDDIKQEKQSVRRILREELGLFKKDSVYKKPKENNVFEIEDEQKKPETKKTLELKKKTEDEDF